MTDTIEDRLVAGETVSGGDLFSELKTRPWRFGVRTAAAFLRAGQPDQALAILEELIENSKDQKELPTLDVCARLGGLVHDANR